MADYVFERTNNEYRIHLTDEERSILNFNVPCGRKEYFRPSRRRDFTLQNFTI